MAELFASGRIIDLILLLVAAEAGLLWLYARRGQGPAFVALAPTLASGALLLLALRAAIADTWWGWIALPLSLALVTHIIDLGQRWRRPRQ